MRFYTIKQHCLATINLHRAALGKSMYDMLLWFLESEAYDKIHDVLYKLYIHNECRSAYKELFWSNGAGFLIYLASRYKEDYDIKHALKKYMSILPEEELYSFRDKLWGIDVPPIIDNAALQVCEAEDIKTALGYLFSELACRDDFSINTIREVLVNYLSDKAISFFINACQTDFEKEISSERYIINSPWDAYCYEVQKDCDFGDAKDTMETIIGAACEDFAYIPELVEMVSAKVEEKAEANVLPTPLSKKQIDDFYCSEIDIVYQQIKEDGCVDRIIGLFNKYKDTDEDPADINDRLWDELLGSADLKHIQEIALARFSLSNLPPEPFHCDAEIRLGGYEYEFSGYVVPSVLLAARVFHEMIDDYALTEFWPHYIKTYNLFFDSIGF